MSITPNRMRFSYAVGRLDRLLRGRLSTALEGHNLTLAEYTTLSVLAARGGLSNAQLARRALITPQAMNEVLARLEARGLVQRQLGAGRARPAGLTAAGRRLLDGADVSIDAVEAAVLEGVTAVDRERLQEFLERISGSLI